jgi:hypothetical protein
MGIKLVWEDIDKTILRHIYEGVWTVADFISAVDESRALLLEAEHPVDLIIDMLEAEGPPPQIMSAYQYADRKVPENQRLIIMVNPNEYMKTFNQVVGKIAPRASENRYVVKSLEDAFTLVVDYREQISQQHPD